MSLSSRVAVLLGPVIATLGKEVASGSEKETSLNAFGAALSGVDPLAIDKLFMDACSMAMLTVHENQAISTADDFERHFSNNRADVYPVMVWVLWECVKDFFPQLAAFGQAAVTKAKG
jgi:hypothetical protein